MQDHSPKSSSRRSFIKSTALATTGFMIVPRHVLGGPGFVAPSDKVNIALIGAGGRGTENLRELLKLDDVQVTAIADPAEYWDLNRFYYHSVAGRGPAKDIVETHYEAKTPNFKVAEYVDFREMLEKESSLDAILCATPDHTHAYISLMAMKAGKHVYCEKPLTHNIWEAREVAKVAKETGLATQMGNQLHSSQNLRQTVEYLRAEAIGKISEIHVWVGATRWTSSLRGVPTTQDTLPASFDWDQWIGPREMRDFNHAYAPVSWRDFWDFGCGAMGDFGCHDLDAPVWGLDLPAPESVVMYPAGYSDENIIPYGEIGYFHFPGNKKQSPINLTWYSGGLKPQIPEGLPKDLALSGRGALYIGEKGVMLYQGGAPKPRLFPEELDASFQLKKTTLSPSNGHHRDWVDAIKGGAKASSHFEYGAHLTEITLLGVLSLRMGGKAIHWDAENMKAKGLPEADAIIRESVRKGWEM
ncbi:MAG: Gfo/Idh/MocA family oxidoreductase [Bacteroidia bacterium]|nr:Gfo/Idh/MocA family oxidoreductase [Bacteroidia bacterium]